MAAICRPGRRNGSASGSHRFWPGRTTWPRPVEFASAGERPLLDAIRRLGGIAHWAREFGLESPPTAAAEGSPARRAWASWDDEGISTAIRPLISELGRWRTKGEFRRAGLSEALAAVYTHGGSARWQRRFGVVPRRASGPVPDRQHWAPELVETELRRFCRDRQAWPAYAEFQATRSIDLYHAAARHGGIWFWQERLELQRTAPVIGNGDSWL
jgi:hypothetical protein